MGAYNQHLLDAISTVVKKMGYYFDITKRGRITEVLPNHRYRVAVQGKTHTIKSNFTYSVGERVFVLYPQGMDTDDLYIYPNR